MKKLLAICLATLALAGCGKPSTKTVIVQQVFQENPSREAYCRSIGLYKEWDSNDCETFADAYDLDEGSSAYKKKKSKYDKKYAYVVVIKDPKKLKAAKAKEKARVAELKKQQAANKAKKEQIRKQQAEIDKLKKEKAAAQAKSKRQSNELKKQQAANKAKKQKSKPISFKKPKSTSKKSSKKKR